MAKPLLNAKELIDKYTRGDCTEEEGALVEYWYDQMQSPEFELPDALAEADLDSAWKNIQAVKGKRKMAPLWKWVGVAASMILIATIALLVINKTQPSAVQTLADVQPGGNKATLTLADGRVINLNDAVKGEIALQAGARIYKSGDGQLVYQASGHNASKTSTQLNIIAIPYGGQYQLTLPDGSTVSLNAGSTLKYPVAFTATHRTVELEGEAYFNVAHDKSQPFIVKTSGQQVEVLGTHFNVSSYANEKKTITTLEEGSVKITSHQAIKIIKPGQQSVMNNGTIEVRDADLESALAWKEGNIVFKSADLQSIMRQIERWYDIKVVYEGVPSKRMFTGGMPRDTKLSVLLDVLRDSNIGFRMEETPQGKKLTVTH